MWPFSRNPAQQPPPAGGRLPEDRYGTQTPPGRSLGILAWLRQIGLPWFGPRLSQGTPVLREVEREKVRLGPPNVIIPQFLPYLDNYTYETPEHRRAYREMWRSPEVKTAVTSKILGVKSLDLKMKPADKKNPRDIEVADFVRWALTRRLRDGVPGLVWSITAAGLADGYSVNAKVRGIQDSGRWAGNIILRELKTIDTGNDGVLQTDDKFNVVGFMGLRYNAGMEFSPADLLIWRNAPQYSSPTGMSDFRAAYNSFWTIDTVKKIRNMGLEKRALPVLLGQYPEGNTTAQASLQAALALAKSQNWLAIPDTTKVEVLNIAGSADAQFQAAIDSEEHKIFLSIQGAYLQSLEGETEQGRGDTQVHKSTSELRVWDLAASLEALINDHEQGLVRELVDLNYVVSDYPYASLTAVDVNELKQDLEVDKGLQGLGLALGKDELYERYDREPPEPGSEDELKPPSVGGGGPPGAGGAPPPPGQPPPGAQLAEPQDFVETDEQGFYHGPEAPGPGWTAAGVGPHGGKRWQRQGGDQQPDEAEHPDHKDDADAQARAHGLIGRLKAGLGRIFGALDRKTDVPAVKQAKRALGAGLRALGQAQTKLYAVMEKRYGKKGAKAIFLAAQATGSNPLVAPAWFIALPGSTLLAQLPLMGVAEGLLQAGRAAKAAGQGLKKAAGFSALAEQLTPEEVDDLARGLVRRLGEAFFEALELRKDDLAEGLGVALGRPAEKEAESTSVTALIAQPERGEAEAFYEEFAAASADRKPGEKWQGPSGKWFTKKDLGGGKTRVVPTTDPADQGGAAKPAAAPKQPKPTAEEKAKAAADKKAAAAKVKQDAAAAKAKEKEDAARHYAGVRDAALSVAKEIAGGKAPSMEMKAALGDAFLTLKLEDLRAVKKAIGASGNASRKSGAVDAIKAAAKKAVAAQPKPAEPEQSAAKQPEPAKAAPAGDINSPEFREWFGDSKVTKPNGDPQETHRMNAVPGAGGKPVIVYHGGADFDEFDASKINPDAQYGPGFYFTESEKEADSYLQGEMKRSGKGKLHKAYLKINKPFDDEGDGIPAKQLPPELQAKARQHPPQFGDNYTYGDLVKLTGSKAAATQALQQMGYDGMTAGGRGGKWWIAFDPKQIKTTGQKPAAKEQPKEQPKEAPAAPKPATPAAPTPEHLHSAAQAVAALAQKAGASGVGRMQDIRPALAQAGLADRAQQDAALKALWKSGVLTGQGFEGRVGTPQERAAAGAAAMPDPGGGHPIGQFALKPGWQEALAKVAGQQPAAKPAAKAQPSGETLRGSIGRELETLRQKEAKNGGSVDVPDLWDRMKAAHPGLTREEFDHQLHDMLLHDELTINVANDKERHPRSSEALKTSKGHRLFIVPHGGTSTRGKPESLGDAQRKRARLQDETAQAERSLRNTPGNLPRLRAANQESVDILRAELASTERSLRDMAGQQQAKPVEAPKPAAKAPAPAPAAPSKAAQEHGAKLKALKDQLDTASLAGRNEHESRRGDFDRIVKDLDASSAMTLAREWGYRGPASRTGAIRHLWNQVSEMSRAGQSGEV